jgi:Helicase conserved C-terminal domain
MPKRDTMPTWLATLDADTLAELLRLRPGILQPPPGSLVTLADRLSLPESVRRAVRELDRTQVDVVAAAQTLDVAPSVSGVLSRVGTGVDRAVVEEALAGLVRFGLAWPLDADRFSLVGPLRGGGSAMLRLGSALAALLRPMTDDELNGLLERLDVEAVRTRAEALAAVEAVFTDVERVRSIAAGVAGRAGELLDELVWHEPVMRTTRLPWEDADEWGSPEQRAVVDAGLVLPSGPDAVELPREAALALRGSGAEMALHLRPPEPRTVPVADVDRVAGAAAMPTVYGVAQLIDLCSTAPLAALRTGGVGVKELRRAAKALGADENRVRLWLTLAYHADLLDNDDGSILPTDDADEWLAAEPAQRLVPLLMTWWRLPTAPTMPGEDGKPGAALLPAQGGPDRALRHDLLGWSSEQPPDRAVADITEVLDVLCWQRPYVHGETEALVGPAFVTVAEAESLGVLAGGALSSWGRALVLDGDVLESLRGVLPAATGSVRLQADLTAVVAGIPTTPLGALLDLAADAGERDTASTWRFSPTSVRRALDAGYTADRLLAELREVSTHDLPQPLVYLVGDVARRHGEVDVLAVACCVRSADETLLTEIAAHRGLTELKPRLIAPTVLGSAKPVRETLALLRKHGYSPTATSESGTPVIERAAVLRARPRPHVSTRRAPRDRVLPADHLHQLAKALLADNVVEAPAAAPAPTTRERLHAYADHLNGTELELLADAISDELPVEIEYTDQNDRRTRRVITPLEHERDFITAWCHMRDDERNFLLSRIRSVRTPLFD